MLESHEDILEYKEHDEYIEITGFKEGEGVKDLVIPSEINDKPVEVIGFFAFDGGGLDSVTLPNSLREVKDFAFIENNITTLTLPYIEKIPSMSFVDNPLEEVIFLEGWIEIGSTFNSSKYDTIKTITLPEGLKVISSSAFSSSPLEALTIPSTVEEIGRYAFLSIEVDAEVTFLGKDTKIDTDAFSVLHKGTIIGKEGSTAQKFAEDRGLTFKVLEEDEDEGSEEDKQTKIGEFRFKNHVLPIYEVEDVEYPILRIGVGEDGIGSFDLVDPNDPQASPFRVALTDKVMAIKQED